MKVDSGLSAIVRNVIRCDRICHRLMFIYYVLAVVIVIISVALFPSEEGTIAEAAFAVGVLLLIGVTVVTRRALRTLRAVKPDLARVSDAARARLKKQRRGSPMQPHAGLGGFFYLCMLAFLVMAGGIGVSVGAASKATVPTQVNVLSCTDTGSRQNDCTYQWQANGRTYHGEIGWMSTGSAGLYDPKHPQVVYDASEKYVNGFTSTWATVLLVGLLAALLTNVRFRKEARGLWLTTLEAELSGVITATSQ